jgi:hypothetical protein
VLHRIAALVLEQEILSYMSHNTLHHTMLALWDRYLTTINVAILVEEDDF